MHPVVTLEKDVEVIIMTAERLTSFSRFLLEGVNAPYFRTCPDLMIIAENSILKTALIQNMFQFFACLRLANFQLSGD